MSTTSITFGLSHGIFICCIAFYCSTPFAFVFVLSSFQYARTELRFYRDVLPIMKDRGFYSAPKVYYVDYNFEGWIAESEPATTPADATLQLEDLIQNEEESSTTTPKGGWLILQCVSTDTYYQNSPLPIPQVQHCLRAAADLHASAWEDHALLTKAEQELSRAAFHLQMRNPKELAGIEQVGVMSGMSAPRLVFIRKKVLHFSVFLLPFLSSFSFLPTIRHGTISSNISNRI